jgi:hypothetical protein
MARFCDFWLKIKARPALAEDLSSVPSILVKWSELPVTPVSQKSNTSGFHRHPFICAYTHRQMHVVLVGLTIGTVQYHDQKQVGEGKNPLAHKSTSWSITEWSQDRNANMIGTWRQELMQRPWRGAVYWLAHCDLLILISCRTRRASPGMAPPLSVTKEMFCRLAYSLISWRGSLNWGSLFPGDSSLYQVHLKLASTVNPLPPWHTTLFKAQSFLFVVVHPKGLRLINVTNIKQITNFKVPQSLTNSNTLKFNLFKNIKISFKI